jgi:PIN domain
MSEDKIARSVPKAPSQATGDAGTPDGELAFDRIYFDTSVLWAERWPNASTTLVNVITFARSLGVSCLVPEPVLIEIEHKWIREFHEKERELNSHSQRISAPRSTAFSSGENALLAHRAATGSALKKFDCTVTPLTANSLKQIFELSAGHVQPFTKDSEFRDRIIWLSIVEDLTKHASSRAVYLCQDNLLSEKEFEAFADQRHVTITIRKRPHDVFESLRKRAVLDIRKKLAREWIADSELAAKAASEPEIVGRLREFVVNTLVISDYNLRAVKRVGEMRITNVQTAFPTDERGKYDISHGFKRKPGDKVKLSIQIEVPLEVRVRKPTSFLGSAPPSVKVGEEVKESTFTDILSMYNPEEVDELWTRVVTIEATAVFNGKGYIEIVPRSLEMAQN